MYRQVLTYNFSDDDTRTSFEELIEDLGYYPADDQSTYVLDYSVDMPSLVLKQQIVRWSKYRSIFINKDDFVQIFYATSVSEEGRRTPVIGSRILVYDKETEGLR